MRVRPSEGSAPSEEPRSSSTDPREEGLAQWVGQPDVRTESVEQIARDVFAVQQVSVVPTLLQTLCEITGMHFSAIARVTEQSWTLCAVQDNLSLGLKPGSPLDSGNALCIGVNRTTAPIVIEQANLNTSRSRHEMPNLRGTESYVSVPIILSNGRYFGNLCAFDPGPSRISASVINMFTLFAAHIGTQLGSEMVREDVAFALREERALGDIRETFIAILGHELRNPLQAILATSDLITRAGTDPAVASSAGRIKANAKRMSHVIDDVLDSARARLGGAISLRLIDIEDINTGLTNVVKELQDAQPDRRIDYTFKVDRKARCDFGRIQQVASNLIGNALRHGANGKAIRANAFTDALDLVIEVWNEGEPISPQNIDKVFEPFWRRDTGPHSEGLGLGLYICSEIIHAHGGQLSVASTREAGTTFTARVPLRLAP